MDSSFSRRDVLILGLASFSGIATAGEQPGTKGDVAPQPASRLIKLSELDKVAEDLVSLFDFSLTRKDGRDWVKLTNDVPFSLIGGDATGGAFLTYGKGEPERLPILYASTYGQAGKLAANLTELLALFVSISSYRDVLKFSGGGSLEAMRKSEARNKASSADDPDHQDHVAAVQRLSLLLAIPKLKDPIETLHRNVTSTDVTLISEEGKKYDSLFGESTAPRNAR